MKKSKPISNISTIIQMAILFAASIHGANAQNSATENLQYQRNDVMGKDSTSLVPNTQMGSVTTNSTTNTSTYTSPPPPVNGSCGASNNSILTSSPTSFLCATGTASAVTYSAGTSYSTGSSYSAGTYSWSCSGNNYGNPSNVASCSAQQRLIAQCGSDNGTTLYSEPTNPSTLCATGRPGGNGTVYDNGYSYSWSCHGNYGAPVTCSAQKYVPTPPPPPPPTCQEDFSYNPLPPCGYVQPPPAVCIAGGWNIQWLSGACGYKP